MSLIILAYIQLPLPQYGTFENASHCLTIIAGPRLVVSGAIFAEIFISQWFTDYIYLGPLPILCRRSALDRSIRRVALVPHALNQATRELEDYHSMLEFTPSPTPVRWTLKVPILRWFPRIQLLRMWYPHLSKSIPCVAENKGQTTEVASLHPPYLVQ